MSKLRKYIVIYREVDAGIFDGPSPFKCDAENADHAEEQCLNAYPDANVLWVFDGDDLDDALTDFYNVCLSDLFTITVL